MERILFIVPMSISFDDFINPPEYAGTISKENGLFGNVLTEMPLGILAMSSYLKKNVKVETKLIDFSVLINTIKKFEYISFIDLFKDILTSTEIIKYNPTIIGISALFSPVYKHLIDLSKICKNIFPSAYIVAGGGVPTNLYKEIYNDGGQFDALCYGEGEIPLLNFVLSKNKKKYLANDDCWITIDKLKKGINIFNKVTVKDLNEIPFYDYDLCETDLYSINPTIAAYVSNEEKKKSFPVMTSRGCPFKCCFCASHSVHERFMRYYNIERVKEDFIRLKHNFNAKTFIFQDDHFLQDTDRALEIVKIVKDIGVTIVFQNGLALHRLTRTILEALYDAGLRQIILPIESGSQRVLKDIMHKPLSLSMVKPIIDNCKDLGIYVDVNILIGLPEETKQDIEEARVFLRSIHANWFSIIIATPLPGSEMMTICKEKKYLKGNYNNAHYKKAIIETKDFDITYIENMRYLMNLELNFVHNSDMRLGNYETAISGFENAIRAQPNHAIAYYYASNCYNKLGNIKKENEYINHARAIINKDLYWLNYFKQFNIEIN